MALWIFYYSGTYNELSMNVFRLINCEKTKGRNPHFFKNVIPLVSKWKICIFTKNEIAHDYWLEFYTQSNSEVS